MRGTFAAGRPRAAGLSLACMALLASLSAASAASAGSVVFVDEFTAFARPIELTVQDPLHAVSFQGDLTNDLHLTNLSGTGTYSAFAGPGRLSVGTDLSVVPSNIAFADTHVFAQYTDNIQIIGLAAGQSVTLHQTLHLSGQTNVTEDHVQPNGPGTGILGEDELVVSGGGVPIGPYFGAFQNAAYATSSHSSPTNHTTDRDLLPPSTIDALVDLVAGQNNFFFLDLDLHSAMFTADSGGGRLTANYNLTWGQGGFLTLNDADGIDTGVRVGGGVSIHALSGFNFLTGEDGGTDGDPVAGVPEPATWALMIVGFGAVGTLMRRRRQGLSAA